MTNTLIPTRVTISTSKLALLTNTVRQPFLLTEIYFNPLTNFPRFSQALFGGGGGGGTAVSLFHTCLVTVAAPATETGALA
jgi:hypothetical protein